MGGQRKKWAAGAAILAGYAATRKGLTDQLVIPPPPYHGPAPDSHERPDRVEGQVAPSGVSVR